MITLNQLAHQFIDDISGGGRTTDNPLDVREVVLKIRQILNELLNLKYFEKYQEGDRGAITMYVATYQITMQNDNDLNRAYIVLPELQAVLPYNRGVHRLFLKSDPDQKDIVLSHNPGIGSRLRAGNVPGVVYAYQEGLRIYFRGIAVEPDEEPETVIYQPVIAAPDSIGLNDPLPIIPDQQAEVLKRLRAMYIPVPQDLVINGNPNK